MDEVEVQRSYYLRTPPQYDEMHGAEDVAHMLALHLLEGYIKFYNISSILGRRSRHRLGNVLVAATLSKPSYKRN
jgi:hypothetical protein